MLDQIVDKVSKIVDEFTIEIQQSKMTICTISLSDGRCVSFKVDREFNANLHIALTKIKGMINE